MAALKHETRGYIHVPLLHVMPADNLRRLFYALNVYNHTLGCQTSVIVIKVDSTVSKQAPFKRLTSKMKTIRHSRRSFITTLITLPLLLAGLWRFLTPKGVKKPTLLQVAQADIPVGAALVFRQERVAIMREGGSFIALSLVCTHLGCTVSVTSEGMVCPCHGSRFDRLGKVLTGPAIKSLVRLTVTQYGTDLVVRG